MYQRIFGAALIAGLLAGLLTAALQFVTTTPLILAAEQYETVAPRHDSHGHGTAADAAAVAVAPAVATKSTAPSAVTERFSLSAITSRFARLYAGTDWQRTGLTAVATIIVSVGLALVLVALMALKGERESWQRGLAWGAGGFAAFSLLPSFGIAPELPGIPAAPLAERQLWWTLTLFASAIGVWLVAFSQRSWAALAGVVLIAAPHIVGAPRIEGAVSTVPAELAARFVATSLTVAAVGWVVTGAVAAHLFGRWRG